MTRFIALPDLHDRADAVRDIKQAIYDADVVLLPGDMTNGNIQNLLHLLNILETYNEFIRAVPGNMDTSSILAYLARQGMSLHRRHERVDDVYVCGVGGALPFAGSFVFNEATLAQFLEDCVRDVPDDAPLVLVCHQPPFETACDRLEDGRHVGSHAIRTFIEQRQPLLCFTGHIHDAVAIDKIGETTIVNPGPLPVSQQYAVAEIIDGVVTDVQILPVKSS